jgi:hypothetical protein
MLQPQGKKLSSWFQMYLKKEWARLFFRKDSLNYISPTSGSKYVQEQGKQAM